MKNYKLIGENMSGKNLIFKNKEKKTRQETADILRLIADKIEEGSLNLLQNNEQVTLSIPETVELELEAKSKEKNLAVKKKLEIEIEWKEGESQDSTLKIL